MDKKYWVLLICLVIAVGLIFQGAVAKPEGKGQACNDGIDNDHDGLIDLKDPGCENKRDKDENNCGDGTCDPNENCLNCPRDCGCPDGELCVEGVCVLLPPPAECITDLDCGDKVCVDGVCVPECTTDADCPAGEECIRGVCFQILPTCVMCGCDGDYRLTCTINCDPNALTCDPTFTRWNCSCNGTPCKQECYCDGDGACNCTCGDCTCTCYVMSTYACEYEPLAP